MEVLKSLAPALSSGVIATLVNQLVLETEPSQREMSEVIKYAGIVAACQFLGAKTSKLVIPEFISEPHLQNLQRIALSGATTSFLNVVSQRYVNNDFRVENSIICGASGGSAGVLVADMFF